jgi:hypothetical protein
MKNRAYCVIRDQPHYRHEAFVAGLQAAGYEVESRNPSNFIAGDVLVTWNRYGYNHQLANHMAQAGGKVLIAENGYIGKDSQGQQLYAIARDGHNGSGKWEIARPPRWPLLGIELKPWREGGNHILVCGQRGIGSPSMASPNGWHDDVAARLKKITKRPVRIRMHPGNNAPQIPLEDDLNGAYAVIIWSSSSGVKALVEGIPVFYEAPHWICSRAAKAGIQGIEDPPDPYRDDTREASVEYMAWAQWTVAEIAAGIPFRLLLK